VARLVETLKANGKKRETIRKSVKYLAAVLDFAGVKENPARGRVQLPYEEPEELNPPSADHVDAVYWLLAPAYRLPLLWLDWSGARVASIDTLTVGDYDERDRRVRLRAATTKTRRALWVALHPVLADKLEATLPPREDRDPNVHCSPARVPIGCGRRSPGPVGRPASRSSRRMICATAGSACSTGRAARGRTSARSSDSGSCRSRRTRNTHVLSDGRELDYERML
jgi:hypothetical protein